MQCKLRFDVLEDRLLTAILTLSAVPNVPRPADRPAAMTVPLQVVNVPGLVGRDSDTPASTSPYVLGVMGLGKNHNQTLVRVRARRARSRRRPK